MRKKDYLFISVLVFLFIVVIAFTFCIEHPDNSTYTKSEVKELCDFDLSKTKYRIKETNDGRFALGYKKYDFLVIDGNENYLRGQDTCYLKFRAYKFWLNDVK